MPYPTLDSLPSEVKALPKAKQRTWRTVWTSAYDKAKKDGDDDGDAEKAATAVANTAVMDEDSKKAAEANSEYLTKLKDLIRSKVKDGDISDADVNAIIKAAAGYSGGKARARKRQEAGELHAFQEGDSIWVGYWLPPDVATQLAIPGGVPSEELHMTMTYIANVSSIMADAVERVQAVVQAFVMTRRAIPLRINGVARFDAGSHNDGQDVVYAVVSSPDLETMRSDLCYELSKVGIDAWGGFYGYTPHITLARVQRGADVTALTLPNLEVICDALTVATDKTAESRTAYPMSGPHFLYGATPMQMSEFIEPPRTIPLLPVPGTYAHPVYGDIVMDEARIEHFISQFDAAVYQDRVPVDLEHETLLGGAAGWITALKKNDDGSVDGVVDWTDRGREALERDRYAFISPTWYDEWVDPISRTIESDVLTGAALTTRPFFKAAALRPLAASEPPQITSGGPIVASPKPEAQPAAANTQLTLSEAEIREFREWREEKPKLTAELAAAKAAADSNAEQTKQMAERVQSIESDRRRERFMAEVMGRSPESDIRWFGEPAQHIDMLEHIATTKGEDSDMFKNHIKQQREIGKQAKGSSLFRETGASGGDESLAADPQVRITDMARKLASEKGISIRDAQMQVNRENPELAHAAAVASQVRV